VPVSIP